MKCDALIAHITQPSMEELLDPTKLRPNHLGYRGVGLLMSQTRPRLGLIGEFWAGYADLRIDLAKCLREISGCDYILPTSIGLHLALPELNVECSQCGAGTAHSNIRVVPPNSAFGDLAYLCPHCVLP
jgi:hypothetical protein